MKRAILISVAVFGVAALAALGVAVITLIARNVGYEWSSLTGPGPIWPAVVGFGALNLMAVSGVVALALLVVVAAVRRSLMGRRTR